MPRSRREDRAFRDWIFDHTPDWTYADRRPGPRSGEPDQVWHTTPAQAPSADGYRIVWIRSSSKVDRDAEARRARIAKGIAALDDLNQRLASPKTRIRTIVAVKAAAAAALDATGAARWITFKIEETIEETFRQENRGRPGAEVLAAYRYQPNLERRHPILKSPQAVAPVYLQTPHRIEALLLCQFLALLVGALIERQIRTAMAADELTSIPLYPELRSCPAPSAPRILEIFTGITRHHLTRHHLTDHNGRTIQIFEPTLTPLQHQVLELLDIPATNAYQQPPSGGDKPNQKCGTSDLPHPGLAIQQTRTDLQPRRDGVQRLRSWL